MKKIIAGLMLIGLLLIAGTNPSSFGFYKMLDRTTVSGSIPTLGCPNIQRYGYSTVWFNSNAGGDISLTATLPAGDSYLNMATFGLDWSVADSVRFNIDATGVDLEVYLLVE